MTRAFAALAILVILVACGPRVRPYAWYRAHPTEAAKVARACGPDRSDDCANAEQAMADAASDRRLDAYRKAF
ncbi:EexN family lipoprotein [Phenylobacterium sp.]|uniref:EexN family lipoprotein n=1 Tax=Phenylobacterium sp. TaxID=1871053 RepID=UPI002F3EB97B